jgi:ABC-2 type transport system permease protein
MRHRPVSVRRSLTYVVVGPALRARPGKNLMNRSLIKKAIVESRLLLASCMTALFGFCWTRVWLVSQFEMSRVQTIVEQFQQFERFLPVPFEQLFTYAGRIALTYDEPIVIVCMSLWAIARGSDCISGEIGRGTMEMLLAQPVSRLQILWSQSLVTVIGTALLAIASWLGVYVGIRTTIVEEPKPAANLTIPWFGVELPNPLAKTEMQRVPMSQRVEAAWFVPAAFNLFSLGVFGAGLSTLLSACDRYRWRTIGMVVGFYIVEMTVKIVGRAADHLAWLGRWTFFTAYEPERFVSVAVRDPELAWAVWASDLPGVWELGPLGYNSILLGIGLAAFAGATLVFRSRDIPAPL